MLLSNYFAPTLKQDPANAYMSSHKLMLRSGMIRQLASGLYSWLPLGMKVLNKVVSVVKKRMDEVGALEVALPLVQPAQLWKDSGRFCEGQGLGGEMLCAKDSSGQDLLIAPSAEEVASYITLQSVQSYRDLPKIIYQVSWKFRDEIRPRHGVMRCREFLMKDAYSFHKDLECAQIWYEKFLNAYLKIYNDLGMHAIPVLADSGDMGGDFNHEFHILSDKGESEIYYQESMIETLKKEIKLEKLNKFYAASSDVMEEAAKTGLKKARSVEVGHIFIQGDKYTQNHKLQGPNGMLFSPITCAYGVGISRIIALIVENNHDAKGIIWPKEIAPFQVHSVNLKPLDKKCGEISKALLSMLDQNQITYIHDDSGDSAGAKLSKADLLGMPVQVIIGPKNSSSNSIEVKHRKSDELKILNLSQAINYISTLC